MCHKVFKSIRKGNLDTLLNVHSWESFYLWFSFWRKFSKHKKLLLLTSCSLKISPCYVQVAAVTPAPPLLSLPSHDDSTSNDTVTHGFFHSTCPIWQPVMNERVEQCLFLSSLFYLSSALGTTVKSIFNHLLLKTCMHLCAYKIDLQNYS